MNVEREDLERAAGAGVIAPEQVDPLWRALQRERAFDAAAGARRADTLGGLAVLGLALAPAAAATWLLVLTWERFDGEGTFALAVTLGVAFLAGARRALRRSPDAAAALVAAAVAMVPVAVNSGLHAFGSTGAGELPFDSLSGWAQSHHFPAVLSLLVSAAWALYAFRLPFLSAVFACAQWLVLMDAAAAVLGEQPSWDQRALLSAVFGVLVLGAGVAADGRTRRDHAGALYAAGLVAFWGGLITYHAETGPSLALGSLVNATLVLASLFLARRIFAVCGLVGLAGIAGQMASDTLLEAVVPFTLLAITLTATAAAVAYLRFERAWRRALVAWFPLSLRGALPPAARG